MAGNAEYAKDWAYSIISTSHIRDPGVSSFFGQVHEPHKMGNFFETEKLHRDTRRVVSGQNKYIQSTLGFATMDIAAIWI